MIQEIRDGETTSFISLFVIMWFVFLSFCWDLLLLSLLLLVFSCTKWIIYVVIVMTHKLHKKMLDFFMKSAYI